MRSKLFLAIVVVSLFTGCAAHSQIPPTTHTVTLTVNSSAPSGSTWVASKAVLTAGATSCPSTSGTTYVRINATAQVSTTFIDPTSSGQTVCEIMQYIDAGGAVSPPSNAVGPYAVLANPTAPTINGQQANAEDKPVAIPAPLPTLAKNTTTTPTITAIVN